MKKLLLLLSLFTPLIVKAQDYQCFQTTLIPFFLNDSGYVRGMRIDSVRMDGNNVIYYPYHTTRGTYYGPGSSTGLNSNGGSWLGKTVIAQPDGTYLFDNIWNDTVVIKTQAQPGDAWTFFDDTTIYSYKATLTSIDTMTILGVLDSVKVITIEADSAGTVNTSDPVNNFQIILSKNNGFAQVFDLYTFPYHRPNSLYTNRMFFDYYLDAVLGNIYESMMDFGAGNPANVGNSIFRRSSFHNPTQKELYDFTVGEIFERESVTNIQSNTFTTLMADTISGKTTTPYSVTYSHARFAQSITSMQSGTTISTGYNTNYHDTYDTSSLLNMNILPEEYGSSHIVYYYPDGIADILDCPLTNYTITQTHIITGDGGIYMSISYESYGIGYGLTDKYSFTDISNNQGEGYKYVAKNGSVCGAFTPLDVENINMQFSNISLSPNPATDKLTISASSPIQEISVTNILGQPVYNGNYKSNIAQIDVSGLAPGIYFARINNITRKFIKN